MIHHYLQKGFKPEYIIKLSLTEKMFYKASMEINLEEEYNKIKAMSGGG